VYAYCRAFLARAIITGVKALHLNLVVLTAFFCCAAGCTSYKTHPILDARGQPLPGSVASLEQVMLGGVPQWILIRGNNVGNPILLKLHGGPGQAEMATVGFNGLLEKDFVVVEWDQRGSGKSAKSIEPRSAMNIGQFAEDTRELTELLLKRFGQRNLILVGHSWGSVVGLKTVQKYPGLYRAFVSTGQIAGYSEGLTVGYRFLVDEAKKRDNVDALGELMKIGPPPYIGRDGEDKREAFGKWLGRFGALWHSPEKFDRMGWMISSMEYSWPEKLSYTRAAQESFELLLPELAALDMNRAVPKVDVPVYFAVGRYDRMAPAEVSQRYFSALTAPSKKWIWFENSAHFPQWEEARKFHEILTNEVITETERRKDGTPHGS
jgi:pimeloyl-ACP methyl ester carboxylesterase